MSAFTPLEVEDASSSEMKPRAPNVAVEITRGCRLTLEQDEMFARYVISLSKVKLEKQFCFAAKENTLHINRLQDGLHALV